MSRSLWAVFLAAILGLAGATSSVSSPSTFVEGAYHNEVMGRMAGTSPAKGVHQLLEKVHATTSNTVSLKLRDLPVGKVIQVGELSYVKVSDNQYLTTEKACIDELAVGGVKNFDYTGGEQTFLVCPGHTYKLEVWGAMGGANGTSYDNYGSYATGNLLPAKSALLNIYVGGSPDGKSASCSSFRCGGYNGGGRGDKHDSGGGGGATDIRINSSSLYARVIVAGGGGGQEVNTQGVGYGDCTETYCGNQITYGTGHDDKYAQQSDPTEAGFGYGGGNGDGAANDGCAGGGGGWYGGSCYRDHDGGGGSSWVYTESTFNYWANNSAEGKSGNWLLDSTCYLTNTSIVAGNATMPNPRDSGSMTGNTGNGYARITRLN